MSEENSPSRANCVSADDEDLNSVSLFSMLKNWHFRFDFLVIKRDAMVFLH